MLFFENVVFEEQDIETDDELSENPEEQAPPPTPEQEINQHIEPIKRYHLISELMKLQSTLNNSNFSNDILNLLVKFSDNIGYQHLLIIVPGLLASIEDQVKRLNNDKKRKI